MPPTKPLRTAMVIARVPEADKKRLQELCRERQVTLTEAMIEGARLYLGDAKRRPRVPTN